MPEASPPPLPLLESEGASDVGGREGVGDGTGGGGRRRGAVCERKEVAADVCGDDARSYRRRETEGRGEPGGEGEEEGGRASASS